MIGFGYLSSSLGCPPSGEYPGSKGCLLLCIPLSSIHFVTHSFLFQVEVSLYLKPFHFFHPFFLSLFFLFISFQSECSKSSFEGTIGEKEYGKYENGDIFTMEANMTLNLRTFTFFRNGEEKNGFINLPSSIQIAVCFILLSLCCGDERM
jgi:hypothetical protein